jgi:hypothetical protein
VGASGSEGGGQQSSWDAVFPRLSDGEGLLHFAATDAAATGVATVAEVAAFWGCSMRCTWCWSRSEAAVCGGACRRRCRAGRRRVRPDGAAAARAAGDEQSKGQQ